MKTPTVGVCVVRFERSPSYVLIKMTTNRSVGVGLHSASPDSVNYFTDVDEATKAVRDFLISLQGRESS